MGPVYKYSLIFLIFFLVAWLITIRKFHYLNTHMLMNAYVCVLLPVAEQSFIFSEGNPAQANCFTNFDRLYLCFKCPVILAVYAFILIIAVLLVKLLSQSTSVCPIGTARLGP